MSETTLSGLAALVLRDIGLAFLAGHEGAFGRDAGDRLMGGGEEEEGECRQEEEYSIFHGVHFLFGVGERHGKSPGGKLEPIGGAKDKYKDIYSIFCRVNCAGDDCPLSLKNLSEAGGEFSGQNGGDKELEPVPVAENWKEGGLRAIGAYAIIFWSKRRNISGYFTTSGRRRGLVPQGGK